MNKERQPLPLQRMAAPWEIKGISESERTVEAIISSESKDRMGDIIRQAGWQLKHYLKNPVVQWAHDYRQPPIGLAESMEVLDPQHDQKRVSKKIGAYLKSVTRFAETDFAEEVFQLFLQEVLRAFSVGFIPKEYEKIYEGEGDDKRFTGYEFTKQELIEYSVVPVPANQDALALAVSKSMIVRTLPDFRTAVPEMCDKVFKVAQPTATPDGGKPKETAADHSGALRQAGHLKDTIEHAIDLLE